jgi:hypothetical protein
VIFGVEKNLRFSIIESQRGATMIKPIAQPITTKMERFNVSTCGEYPITKHVSHSPATKRQRPAPAEYETRSAPVLMAIEITVLDLL